MNPTVFRPLGHSGLIVSPLCLGTMTFDVYAGGRNSSAGNPNAGGNGRKNIQRALEGSLGGMTVQGGV